MCSATGDECPKMSCNDCHWAADNNKKEEKLNFGKPILWGHPTHNPTPSQIESFQGEKVQHITEIFPKLSIFLQNCSDNNAELIKVAREICDKINGFSVFQLGGSPALLGKVCLEIGRRQAFNEEGVDFFKLPILFFSHSEKKSVETVNADGSVSKNSIFQHIKWIEL
jgi:hypothetical protein